MVQFSRATSQRRDQRDYELLDDEAVVDETNLARLQLHLCRINNEDPLLLWFFFSAGDRLSHAREPVLRVRDKFGAEFGYRNRPGAEAQSSIKIIIALAARAVRQVAPQVPGFGPPGAPFRCQTAS